MTALEEYTAHHAERAEDVMYRWPWRRFEVMFKRHLMRKAREELRQMRDLRVAALDANTNFDSKENQDAKRSRVEGYHKAYVEGVKILYGKPGEPEPDPLEDDPFFNPVRRRAEQMRSEVNQPLTPQAGMGRQLLEATS